MREDKKILGLVLARGGSKAVPHKNIKELNGRPLMSYIIEQAKKSKYLKEVWVSSDEREILKIADEWGALGLQRPKELSDGSKPIQAIQHWSESMKEMNGGYDIMVLLNACCPLTLTEDIDEAIRIALETDCDSVTSLVEDFSSHPSKLCRLDDDKVVGLGETFETGERQKQDHIFKRNTAIYLSKKEVIDQGLLFGKDTRGYVMSKERSWDINDMWDWAVAEFLVKR